MSQVHSDFIAGKIFIIGPFSVYFFSDKSIDVWKEDQQVHLTQRQLQRLFRHAKIQMLLHDEEDPPGSELECA